MKSTVLVFMCVLSISLVPAFGQPTNPCAPPPPGMSAWWTFDETNAPSKDIGGAFNNLGTWFGDPSVVPGVVSNAICFQQTNDFIVVSNQAEVDFRGSCTNFAESFTIDAWVLPSSNGPRLQTMLDKRFASGQIVIAFIPTPGYSLFLNNGVLGFLFSDGTPAFVSGGPDYATRSGTSSLSL